VRESELELEFVRSGGPGGQHVNKVSSRVDLIFDIKHSPSLNDEQRARLAERLKTRINADGVLRLVERGSRSQWQNRQKAVERFLTLMQKTLRPAKKRRATRPTVGSKEQRLKLKKQHSEKKKHRWRTDHEQ